MSRTRAGEQPEPQPAPDLVWVHPLPDFWVMDEPATPHQVTAKRAAVLLSMPHPAFTTTAPDGWSPPDPPMPDEGTIDGPADAGVQTED